MPGFLPFALPPLSVANVGRRPLLSFPATPPLFRLISDDDANEEESDDGLAFRLQVIQITEAEVADVGRVYALTLSDGVNFHGFFLHPRLAHYVCLFSLSLLSFVSYLS